MTRFKTLSRRILAVTVFLTIAASSLIANPGKAHATSIADAITAIQSQTPWFVSFTGTVIEIRDYVGDSSKKFVVMEDKNEALMNFVSTEDTYYPEGTVLSEGMTVTGYYDARKPMLMIYPPQPNAVAFWASGDEGAGFVKVDRFDENLVSNDGQLKLNLSDDMDIILQDGSPFTPEEGKTMKESLPGKALMVFYDITTRSIPAQTTPKRIVVLNDTDITMQGGEALGSLEIDSVLPAAGSPVGLVVAGNKMTDIELVLAEDNIIMVPLYLVCNELGFELEWNAETRTALVGQQFSAVIGNDEYTAINTSSADGVVIALGAPPVIVDERTYVPLSFFTQVMGLNNAYFLEGQIVIDNFEKME